MRFKTLAATAALLVPLLGGTAEKASAIQINVDASGEYSDGDYTYSAFFDTFTQKGYYYYSYIRIYDYAPTEREGGGTLSGIKFSLSTIDGRPCSGSTCFMGSVYGSGPDGGTGVRFSMNGFGYFPDFVSADEGFASSSGSVNISFVPLPAGAGLFGLALLSLGAAGYVRRRGLSRA